jgi:hypothetical protein
VIVTVAEEPAEPVVTVPTVKVLAGPRPPCGPGKPASEITISETVSVMLTVTSVPSTVTVVGDSTISIVYWLNE